MLNQLRPPPMTAIHRPRLRRHGYAIDRAAGPCYQTRGSWALRLLRDGRSLGSCDLVHASEVALLVRRGTAIQKAVGSRPFSDHENRRQWLAVPVPSCL